MMDRKHEVILHTRVWLFSPFPPNPPPPAQSSPPPPPRLVLRLIS